MNIGNQVVTSPSTIGASAAERLGVPGLKDIDISGWNLGPAPLYGQIVTIEDFAVRIRPELGEKILVVTSGGFDPIQPGHSSCIIESRQFGDVVAVIVNGDWFLDAKKNPKGDVKMENLRQRCQVISHIREVDYVIPFEIEGDLTVSHALRVLKPDVFTKGGDRTSNDNTPEGRLCSDLNIRVEFGVGSRKVDSSSWIAQEYFCSRLRLLANQSIPGSAEMLEHFSLAMMNS